MMKRSVLLGLLLFVFGFYKAQTVKDSVILLQEYINVAKANNYAIGYRQTKLDSIQMEKLSGESLSKMLTKYIPIYVKQDAGGLSTISVRGTSASHTAILFGPVNLNSLTLGHSNMSNIPMFLFDEMEMTYGASGSLNGSDAIGGTIKLFTEPKWTKGKQIVFQQEIGSFNRYFTGLKVFVGNGKWESVTKAYRYYKKNNFPFVNTTVKDFKTQAFVSDTQKNAEIKNQGLLQEINYRIDNKKHFSFKAWYDQNYHEIQPNMSANYYNTEESFTDLYDRHLRLITDYTQQIRNHRITASIAYINDFQIYNRDLSDVVETKRGLFNLSTESIFKKNNSVKFICKSEYIVPNKEKYQGIDYEVRTDLALSYLKKCFDRLNLSVNIRKPFVTHFEAPFSPSIGIDYLIYVKQKQTVKVKASGAGSYKIPTFNDRFWPQLGNPNLLPERGLNYECGLDHLYFLSKLKLKTQLNVYYMIVNNWINWVPISGEWRPQNTEKVESKGLEVQTQLSYLQKKIDYHFGFGYNYNSAITIKESNKPDIIGKQLAYTPRNIANTYIHITYNKKWIFGVDASYTGERFTNKINDEKMKAYQLINLSVNRKFIYNKKYEFSITGEVENLLNQAYENQIKYAMPGRSYYVRARFSIS